MLLTTKDKAFLETLRQLLDDGELRVDFKEDGVKRIILRQNYGAKIARHFGMSRQGVRWRFDRLFNSVYPEAYERVYWIEATFGHRFRPYGVAIAKQRVEFRRKAQKLGPAGVGRR